jgi:hypothetical protein
MKFKLSGGTHAGEFHELGKVSNWICLESNQPTLPGEPLPPDEFYFRRGDRLQFIKQRAYIGKDGRP